MRRSEVLAVPKWSFSQLPAVKKDHFGAARQNFGPSYSLTALLIILRIFFIPQIQNQGVSTVYVSPKLPTRYEVLQQVYKKQNLTYSYIYSTAKHFYQRRNLYYKKSRDLFFQMERNFREKPTNFLVCFRKVATFEHARFGLGLVRLDF